MPKPASADPEIVAISALSFLAEDPARLSRFLDITGLSPATLREAAGEPRFLASVLDYLMADESLLLAFAAHSGISPETIAAASAALARA
jgi:fructoselysine-6-P-deglycase FrlB-like protein